MRNCNKFVNFFPVLCFLAMLWGPASAGATTYYVSTGGNNSKLGTSKDTAWRTITYAATKAKAGDTVYIAGGDYGNEKVVVSNSGTSSAPIVFEGYNGTPLLNQGARVTAVDYSSIGLRIVSKKYVTLRNLSATLYQSCFQIESSSYITLDNVNPYTCGYTVAYGYGICLISCNHCTLKNCTVTDCGGVDIQLAWSDYNTLENCNAIGTLSSSDTYATDYYNITSWSSNNTFKNCVSNDTTLTGKGNHGIGIKDTPNSDSRNTAHGHSTGNQYIDCKAYGIDEGLLVAHGCYGNTFTNCIGDFKNKYDPFATGIMVRDGAINNTFLNCRAIGCGQAVCIYAGAENTTAIQSGNKFIDCIFQAKERNPALPTSPTAYLHPNAVLFFRNAQNNTFENCSLVNGKSVFRFGKNKSGVDANSGNKFSYCTVYNNTKWYDTQTLTTPWVYSGTGAGYDDTADITWTNCNFWLNGFSKPSGTGNVSYAPTFVDPASGDYHVVKNAVRRNWAAWR